jgi:hypothetical protein
VRCLGSWAKTSDSRGSELEQSASEGEKPKPAARPIGVLRLAVSVRNEEIVQFDRRIGRIMLNRLHTPSHPSATAGQHHDRQIQEGFPQPRRPRAFTRLEASSLSRGFALAPYGSTFTPQAQPAVGSWRHRPLRSASREPSPWAPRCSYPRALLRDRVVDYHASREFGPDSP